ncbi:MAG: M20/M25/M40 family metallo-hydrolase [Chloroflexi bacterium]|nr:M20/M25/M40 family metallo-hydrolase [Chloroflexota bacterium]
MKEQLLAWIEQDRDRLVDFLSRFVQVPSPNPPGDTRDAMAFVQAHLDAAQMPYRLIAPRPAMPNLVASFDAPHPGRHLVLNGHVDVFPVSEDARWSFPPWSGATADGKLYGRGATDMKAGTTAIVFVYGYLHRIREQLRGTLTLTCVSDEETFGTWGSKYLVENHPETHGDCVLNAEPSGPYCVRFGEKGLLWLELIVETPGAHGAYAHMSESATKVAARLVGDLEQLTKLTVDLPVPVRRALDAAHEELERTFGAGATGVIPAISLNVGIMEGGVKVNMIPSRARIELDIRLPIGASREYLMFELQRILRGYPQVTVREAYHTPANWCDPAHPLLRFVQDNARQVTGIMPKPVVSLGGTDSRFWRFNGIPAFIYGVTPHNMGAFDEHVLVDEFLNSVRVYTLAAYDYLTAAGA